MSGRSARRVWPRPSELWRKILQVLAHCLCTFVSTLATGGFSFMWICSTSSKASSRARGLKTVFLKIAVPSLSDFFRANGTRNSS